MFYSGPLKTTIRNYAPIAITGCVLLLISLLYVLGEATKERAEGEFRLDVFDRLECMTYDARVRMAAASGSSAIATNLATLFIDDDAIELVNEGVYGGYMAPAWDDQNIEGLNFSAPWPRFMYGQLIREMSAQGAKAVGFDILFSELDLKSPDTDVILTRTNIVPAPNAASITVTNIEPYLLSSDEFFAHEMAQYGRAILATEGGLLPQELFAKQAAAVGNIAAQNDYGVLRRVRAFGEYKEWNPKVLNMAKAVKLRMRKASLLTPGFLKIPFTQTLENPETNYFKIPLLPNGNLMLTKDGDLNTEGDKNDLGPDNEPPYTMRRAWNLGIVLAAMDLGLDLDKAVVEPHRIILTATNGLQRIIPTDKEHRFYIDWSQRFDQIKSRTTPVLYGSTLQELSHDFGRRYGTNHWDQNEFTNRLVIVGSVATGNNLIDMGATPLEEKTPLVTKHLNVANSILTDRFVRKMSTSGTIGLIWILGALSAWLTWRAKVVNASGAVAVVALIYIGGAFALYVQTRYWLPIVMPIFGGLIMPHFSLVTYRVVFEQREQRHIKSVFQRMVAPDVVQELLQAERLSLGGVRREITVYFADVRGFTEFTDRAQKEAEEYVKRKNLSDAEAETYFDEQARETLDTVNGYLSTIADQIKNHKGVLDKYIGDCVMAFWGAPVPQKDHALCAVRAAIDSQRAMYALNQRRAETNEKRKTENIARVARGEEPLGMLPLLTLGTGINTGMMTAGLMGSEAHITNYTVFGVEVNLASRLEGVSGRGRIIIGGRTYECIKERDPALAATCIELEPVKVKGISNAVRNFEVPWRQPELHAGQTVNETQTLVPTTKAVEKSAANPSGSSTPLVSS